MKYNNSSRAISEHAEQIKSSLLASPTLIKASGIATIAGAAISGVNAAIITIIVLILLLVMGITTILDGDRLEYPVKNVVYTAVSVFTLFAMLIVIYQIIPEQIDNIGIYAPLLAFNSLVLCRSEKDAPMLLGSETVTDAVALTAVFAIISFPVAIIREIIGSGELFGISLGFVGNKVFLLPFAGFILAGYLISIIRRLLSLFDGKERRA